MSKEKKALFVTYGYPWCDPPQRQAVLALRDAGYECAVFMGGAHQEGAEVPDSVTELFWKPPAAFSRFPQAAKSVSKFLSFRRQLALRINEFKPDVLLAFMFHALASLPKRGNQNGKLVGAVWDIYAMCDAGRVDRWLIPAGLQKLAQADVVWCSDPFKGLLTQQLAGLSELPVICHNCPTRSYLPEPGEQRDGWLRAELRKQGATLSETGGCILLRAGAVGEHGGIEETLDAMGLLPEEFVFLLMGRPTQEYKKHLMQRIAALRLQKRAIFWDRPSGEVWKRALQGADIGHLIHGPFPAGRMTRLYELNSSLSNNRLFQYMAAGLPIIAYDDPRMNNIYAEVPCFRVARLANLAVDVREAWRELGASSSLCNELGSIGRRAHLAHYCWEKQFAPILQALGR